MTGNMSDIGEQSYQVWNAYPGNTPSNPNTSPICGQKIRVTHTGDDGKQKSIVATVGVDLFAAFTHY